MESSLKSLYPKRDLIDRINQSIRAANNRGGHMGRKNFGILTKPLNRKGIYRAVAIARNPGPHMDFKAGELDELLIAAGFRPSK